jgi:hypothetical protein
MYSTLITSEKYRGFFEKTKTSAGITHAISTNFP